MDLTRVKNFAGIKVNQAQLSALGGAFRDARVSRLIGPNLDPGGHEGYVAHQNDNCGG